MLKEAIREGIISIDDHGIVTVFNQGAEQILGYAREEVIGQPIINILKQAHTSHLPEGSLPSVDCAAQYSLINKQGNRTNLHIFNASIAIENQTHVDSILLLRDLTDMEAVETLRSNFLASISQEFHTPLAAINASVELLLEELECLSAVEISALLNSVYISVSGLQALIDNLLESMNIEADHIKIRRQPTDLDLVIEDAIQSMQPLLNRREQELYLHIQDSIPRVMVDPSKLTQAIVNLLSNASKFSPIAQPIDLYLEKQDKKYIQISVMDRGTGILPDERSQIFHRFTRTGDPDNSQFGMGLGLSVVKAIVEGHGGEVGTEGRDGGGSIFWFKLPYNIDGTP